MWFNSSYIAQCRCFVWQRKRNCLLSLQCARTSIVFSSSCNRTVCEIYCVLVSCEGTRRRLLSLARAVTARSGFSPIGSSRHNAVRSLLVTSCELYQAHAVAVTATVDARQSLIACCYLGNAVCQFSKISFTISATTYVLVSCLCRCVNRVNC